MESISFTVLGECASKANSRQPAPAVSKAGRSFIRFIKSPKARAFEAACARQIPYRKDLWTCDVEVWAIIFYASRRPDLDESLLLDCIQGRIIKNDRQVKSKIITWGLDPKNPRCEVTVTPLEGPLFEESPP